MESNLLNFTNEFKTELDQIKSEYFKFEFNTAQLPEVQEYTHNRDIRKHSVFEKIFDDLESLKTHCLYWFSVNYNDDAIRLKNIINQKRIELRNDYKTFCRILPASNENIDSSIIYVGVRKGSAAKTQKITNISGRIVQHLGYYKEGGTQGLQLAYYANELNINMTLHVYSLKECPDEYLYILEKIFAKKLSPICGKH